MVRCASLFSQVLSLINRHEFAKAVNTFRAEKAAKGFACWDQFVAMLFCQLAQAKSLREIVQGLLCCEGKLQHLGVRAAPKRSTLSYANAQRPWKLFEAVFYQLLGQCQQAAPTRTKFRFQNKLLLLDATVIDLCVTLFDWARFRTTKGAIKLHLLLDHDGYLPVFAHITEGRQHEMKLARGLCLPRGSVVAMLLVKYLQLRAKLGWALSNLIALLRWNLFTYRDLWQWIDAPFETLPGTAVAKQTWLMLDSIQPPRPTTST
jgi:hypothetical protein